MDLSVIIVSFNTKILLERCLRSLFQSLHDQTITYEVLVVDNASTDGSEQLVKKQFPQVKLYIQKENIGFGRANNFGIRHAQGSIVLLLNSDTVVLSNAVSSLYQFSQKNPDSFIGGKLLNEDKSPQASAGPMVSLSVVFAMLFLKGDTLGWTRWSPDQVRQVDWVSGACLMGRKKLFLDVGLFDEHIFMYMEEIDLLYRASQKGYTTLFYPEAIFIHTGAASSGQKREPVVNIFRGLHYFYQKHKNSREQQILRYMILLKAFIAKTIGFLTGNRSLYEIYEKAYTVAH